MSSDNQVGETGDSPVGETGQMPAPMVSVVMCTYNGTSFIRQQLESVLHQSLPPDEIIIADDDSQDGTVELIRSIIDASSPTRIQLIHRPERLGVAANFARGIQASAGDLIALADQDDVWVPERLERQVQEFRSRPDLTLLHSDAALIGPADEVLPGSLFRSLSVRDDEKARIHNGEAFSVLLRRNVVTGATIMFRRELLNSALPFGQGWIHDEWLAIVAAAVGRVDFTEEALVEYRQHGSNQIGASDPRLVHKISRVFQARGERLEKLAERSHELVRRLEALPSIDDRIMAAGRGKESFENLRRSLPRRRWKRVRTVLVALIRGDYRRYASQRALDVLRDLIQGA